MSKILITGGSGIIGSELIPKLIERGHEIHLLSRSNKSVPGVKVFLWDIEKEFIDSGALENVDHIIHLAGYNVGEGRWTGKRKKLIEDSRIKAVTVIKKHLGDQKIKSFISASGISIYGTKTSDQIFDESAIIDLHVDDYLGHVTSDWEAITDVIYENVNRIVFMRTSVVLSRTGGALEKISSPIKKGMGTVLGSGKQWMPWVHIDDVVSAYILIIENSEMKGAFNIAAPEHVNNKDFTHTCARILGKKIWLPNVPTFILKIVFGQMANIVLKGSRVSGEKIKEYGFEYQHKKLETALNDILSKISNKND